ncbi:hypothetical protein ACB098_07G079900 [Castanea mollissima]
MTTFSNFTQLEIPSEIYSVLTWHRNVLEIYKAPSFEKCNVRNTLYCESVTQSLNFVKIPKLVLYHLSSLCFDPQISKRSSKEMKSHRTLLMKNNKNSNFYCCCSTLAELLSMPVFVSIHISFWGVTLFGKPLSLFSL